MRNDNESLEWVVMRNNVEFVTKKYFKNRFMQEDVIQDCLEKIHNNINKYDNSKAKLNTWASKVANNYCIDILRKQKREQRYIYNIDAGKINIVDAITDNFKDQSINLAYKHVSKMFAEYKQLHVEILLFCKKDSNSYKAASVKYNMSIENVRTIISRLKKSLRQRITKLGETEKIMAVLS